MSFLYDSQNEMAYFKWGFTFGACLSIFGFIFGFTGGFFAPEGGTTFFSIFGLWLLTNLVVLAVYPFVLYFALKKVDSIVLNITVVEAGRTPSPCSHTLTSYKYNCSFSSAAV